MRGHHDQGHRRRPAHLRQRRRDGRDGAQDRKGRGLRRQAGAGLLPPRRELRPPRVLHDLQEAGDAGLRPARRAGHRPQLRHRQPRRLPRARLHHRHRGAAERRRDGPAGHRGQGGPDILFQNLTAALDSSGACLFSTFGIGGAELAEMLSALTGVEYSLDEFLKIGERIWNQERLWNLGQGYTTADDTLPDRLLNDPIKTGPAKGEVSTWRHAAGVLPAARLGREGCARQGQAEGTGSELTGDAPGPASCASSSRRPRRPAEPPR